jgi:hypothetical protein
MTVPPTGLDPKGLSALQELALAAIAGAGAGVAVLLGGLSSYFASGVAAAVAVVVRDELRSRHCI